jgi:multidrug transporter EmrE-like cation transporter
MASAWPHAAGVQAWVHKEGVHAMNASKLAGMVLIVAGLLGLVYGGFSYTKDTTVVKLGPIELTAKEKERVNVPLWAGVGAIVAGVVLLSLGGRKG